MGARRLKPMTDSKKTMNTIINDSIKESKIPIEYYTMRKTKKELFIIYLQRAINKVKE